MKNKNTKNPTPVGSTLLRVERGHGRIYCLIELSIFENTVYCISVTGDDFAAELVGEDAVEAQKMFETLCDEFIPSYHLFDIVSDMKRENLAKNR
jgi:hypothetical protein